MPKELLPLMARNLAPPRAWILEADAGQAKITITLVQWCDFDIFLPNNYIEDRPGERQRRRLAIGVRSDRWNARVPGPRRLGVDQHPMNPVPWETSEERISFDFSGPKFSLWLCLKLNWLK
jgi:hypothetical protein